MPALAAGAYPVYVTPLLTPCQVQDAVCATASIRPAASDTLLVSDIYVTSLSEMRAQSPKVEMRGSRAAFLLPEGIGGTWKAELVTVAGKQIRALTVTGEGGSRTEMDFGAALQAGVYLLRLHAPDGDTHVLPIVRQATRD
jgi:hypothetical protein